MSRRSILRGYEDTAEAYARAFREELAGKPYDRLILDRFAEITAGGTVCDVGSGPAQISAHVRARPDDRRPLRLIALDLAHGMLRQARLLVPDIAPIRADMLRLPFSDDSLHGILSFYAIVHHGIEPLADIFSEWKRVLRPGGWLLLSFHCGQERLHVDEFLGEAVDMEWIPLDPDAVLALLDAIGLRREACVVRYPYPEAEYPSKRAYFLLQKPDEQVHRS